MHCMLDELNEGWIEFENDPADILRGEVELATVLRELVAQAA